MQVIVGIYTAPETRKHWIGWLEPYDPEPPHTSPAWIAFVNAAGEASFYERDPSGNLINPPPQEERDGPQDQVVLNLEGLQIIMNRMALELLRRHANTEANTPRPETEPPTKRALAMEWAARIWTRPENAGRTMDSDLAISIAEALLERESTSGTSWSPDTSASDESAAE